MEVVLIIPGITVIQGFGETVMNNTHTFETHPWEESTFKREMIQK